MRLLFDQNLSRRLVQLLAVEFPDSRHVTELGLDTATDREIWEYARVNAFAIVSKDSDFRQFAFLFGAPPKLVWIRIGNVSTKDIEDLLRHGAEAIEAFDRLAEEALLALPATQ